MCLPLPSTPRLHLVSTPCRWSKSTSKSTCGLMTRSQTSRVFVSTCQTRIKSGCGTLSTSGAIIVESIAISISTCETRARPRTFVQCKMHPPADEEA